MMKDIIVILYLVLKEIKARYYNIPILYHEYKIKWFYISNLMYIKIIYIKDNLA